MAVPSPNQPDCPLGRIEFLNRMLLADTLDVKSFMDALAKEALRMLPPSLGTAVWLVSNGALITQGLGGDRDPAFDISPVPLASLEPALRNDLLSRDPVERVGPERVCAASLAPEWAKARGVAYLYRHPVIVRESVAGILAVVRTIERPLDTLERDIMRVLASQAAISIRNFQIALETARDVAAAKDEHFMRLLARIPR
jgi:hypothetical protein